MSLGKLIQKGRQDKGMTQKELATKICEKPQIVNEYEQGKGIPNNQIMIKIEKAIGIKLRGKDKGEFGMYVVGKWSWKDRDVGEFLVGKFFPSSSLYMGDR